MFESAKKIYAKYGIDVEKAMDVLSNVPVAIHCWQGDDVRGFDRPGPLTGGIQTTGNYIGRATNFYQLSSDMELAFSLIPGKKKINVHACYAVFEDGDFADRDKLEPKHFKKWVEFAKKLDAGIDFNPTFFSHPLANGLTLASADEGVRKFWVKHGQACVKISEYFAKETGVPCVMNIWTGDGFKDTPADRLGPRLRYQKSLDEILSIPYDKNLVKPCVESKVFGIGVESYTVGSAEFTLSYAATRGILPLMDNGHYHPTEVVSDKISSLLCFYPEIALHVTRGVRWDSDHVLIFDDETKEIAKEIVRNDALNRVYIALDYFDASINRIAAWVTGARNMQKALLYALLEPSTYLKNLQDNGNFTELLVAMEEVKTLPFGAIWDEYVKRQNVKGADWLDVVKEYEKDILSERE